MAEQEELLRVLQRDAAEDPRALDRLYALHHLVTQARRGGLRLGVLGEEQPAVGGTAASLLDVVRIALSMINHFPRVEVGEVAGLVVAGPVAEDLALLVAELLDNAIRYGLRARVGTYRTEHGAVALTVTDEGTACGPDWIGRVNSWLAGPVVPLPAAHARQQGLAVVHRLARRHALPIVFGPMPGGPGQPAGMAVTVYLRPGLLTRLPAASAKPGSRRPGPPEPAPPPGGRPAATGLPVRRPGASLNGRHRMDATAPQAPAADLLTALGEAFSSSPSSTEF